MSPNLTPTVAICLMIAIGIGYFIFLIACWNDLQRDKKSRNTRLDEMLDKLPKVNKEPPLPDGI